MIHSLKIRGTVGPIYRALLDLIADNQNVYGAPDMVMLIPQSNSLLLQTTDPSLIDRVRDLIPGHEKAEGRVFGFNDEADLPERNRPKPAPNLVANSGATPGQV